MSPLVGGDFLAQPPGLLERPGVFPSGRVAKVAFPKGPRMPHPQVKETGMVGLFSARPMR